MTELQRTTQAILDAVEQKGYVNMKNDKDAVRMEALRKAIENLKPYTPMTTDEWLNFREECTEEQTADIFVLLKHIERAIIERAGVKWPE